MSEEFEKWLNDNDDPDAPYVPLAQKLRAAFLAGQKAKEKECIEICENEYRLLQENALLRDALGLISKPIDDRTLYTVGEYEAVAREMQEIAKEALQRTGGGADVIGEVRISHGIWRINTTNAVEPLLGKQVRVIVLKD